VVLVLLVYLDHLDYGVHVEHLEDWDSTIQDHRHFLGFLDQSGIQDMEDEKVCVVYQVTRFMAYYFFNMARVHQREPALTTAILTAEDKCCSGHVVENKNTFCGTRYLVPLKQFVVYCCRYVKPQMFRVSGLIFQDHAKSSMSRKHSTCTNILHFYLYYAVYSTCSIDTDPLS